MDYESFGEHQWADTGIFDFLRNLPTELLRHPNTTFRTATETVQALSAIGDYDVPDILTWADTDRDLTAWVGNDIQRDAIAATFRMEEDVLATDNLELIETWRKLTTSDHFYFMCTKWSEDGDVHAYFSPYESPYEAYINFMNALTDLRHRVDAAKAEAQAARARVEAFAPQPKGRAATSARRRRVSPGRQADASVPSPLSFWAKLRDRLFPR
jgi:alpha-amylase